MRRLLTAITAAALLAAPALAQGATQAPAGAYVSDKTHTTHKQAFILCLARALPPASHAGESATPAPASVDPR